MKKVLLIVLAGLLLATPAMAKVLADSWGYHGSASADPKWRGYHLTWATSGVADSFWTSLLPDSNGADTDTTNAFFVAGLFPTNAVSVGATRDSSVCGVLIFRAVADTTCDSVAWCMDYSYDDVTWFTGKYWLPLTTLGSASGFDTTYIHTVRSSPDVSRGCETMAPLWRMRIRSYSSWEGVGAGGKTRINKKLKRLETWFWAGGR